MAETPGKDLATFDPASSKYPVLFSDGGEGSVAQIIEDNFGDEGFSTSDLDRLTVPAGGGTSWEVPDEDPTRVIEGVIVHKQPTRSFWFKKRGEDGEDDGPPDCYSNDGRTGNGVFGLPATRPEDADPSINPSGECTGCPMNEYGSSTSGSGNGKGCKEQMQLFMLQEGSVLPIQISLPPTSLKGFRKYMTRLASKGKSFMTVVTALSLSVEKGGGQTYSVVNPARSRDLEPAEAAAARGYGQTIKGVLDEATAQREAAAAAALATQPLDGDTAQGKQK